jgi:hypothetical protein
MIEYVFEYTALSGWLITCGVQLLILAWMYKKSTSRDDT